MQESNMFLQLKFTSKTLQTSFLLFPAALVCAGEYWIASCPSVRLFLVRDRVFLRDGLVDFFDIWYLKNPLQC